nr:uncharacterized protein LOC127312853 [Lolium perenne]
MGAQPGSTQMQSGIPTTGMPVVNSTSSSMRPEATLLAVAGLSAPPVPAVASPREASGDVPLAKKKKASTCFRCDQPGHCLNDCNAVICDCCQDPQHATRDCPLLLAPKPTMVMYGLAHEELMFWDTPLSQSVRPRLENTRMGRVTISGGQMTVEEIITQLRWIVPEENYHWEVVQMEENVYRVNFPSKIDLVRVQHFGRFNVPSSEIFMTFDFWTRNVQPAWRAEDVWVRVYDLPSPALDDFLALWAIGTLFGKTRDIDMTFTRANDVLRICITCLDPTLIPAQMDVRVQDDFFRLRFEVEGLQPYVPQDTTMADAPNGDGDMEHDGHTDDSVPDVTKDTAPDEQANNTNNSNGQKDTFMPPGQRNLNLTPIQFGSYGSGIINKSTQSGRMIEQVDVLDGAKELQYVLSEVADDRMSDKALDCADPADNHGAVKAQPIMHGVAMAHPIMHGATSIGGANAPIQHKIHGTPTTNGARAMPYSSISTSTGGTHDAVPGAAVRSAGVAHVITPSILTSTNDMSKVMGVSPTNKPSMEEVISFGGISRGSDMGLRSSDRIRRQPNADATQMERAMDLAQRRDDTSGQGYSQSYTLDSTMGVPAPGRPAGGYGYWMQPFANGYSGLLFRTTWAFNAELIEPSDVALICCSTVVPYPCESDTVMTVVSGGVEGDTKGDAAKTSIGGRFWCLSAGEDEDEGSEVSPSASSPEVYGSSTPEVSLVESSRKEGFHTTPLVSKNLEPRLMGSLVAVLQGNRD